MDIWLESYRWFISALFSFQGTPPNCSGHSPFLANRLCYCIAWSFSCQAVFSAFVRQNDITLKSSCTRFAPCVPPCGDLYNDTGFSPACQHLFWLSFRKIFCVENGVLGGTRTPDPLIRSQILWSNWATRTCHFPCMKHGGPTRTRTWDRPVMSRML